MKYLGIDIGGTWIKGTVVDDSYFSEKTKNKKQNFQINKIKSPLNENTSINEFTSAIIDLVGKFQISDSQIAGIGISTGGIINYHGSKILKAAKHLSVLKNESWKSKIEKELNCIATLINDADAAAIGVAELGLLNENKTIGIMPLGTGLGFSVWRNGRRWRPGKSLTLLGSIRTPHGLYDNIASASSFAAKDNENNLINVLTHPSHKDKRNAYFNNISQIINTAGIIYKLDEVLICGGLADAANSCNFELENELQELLSVIPPELDKTINVSVLKEGNRLQLIGALALAKSESIARNKQVHRSYESIPTEVPYEKNIQLEELATSSLSETLWKAEQEAGNMLRKSLKYINKAIDDIYLRLQNGGRLIYVGSGTSGRVAAMDAVEIPCTYGFPEEKILCLIAGGIADASIEIESNFEEDASAVPEMLLLNLTKNDAVIGISASGTAYYIQSALAMAKEKGAYTAIIQSIKPTKKLPFCDNVIPLNSGNEVVAGSTRMKAGTATKKILNFISSSLMIKMGKVAGPYMIDLACINNKLIERALSILNTLYGIEKNEALQKLQKANMNLNTAINDIKISQNK